MFRWSTPSFGLNLVVDLCVCHGIFDLSGLDHSHSSTTMSSNVALWFLPFSLGLIPKHVYWPPSSKVMFHNRMEMLLFTLLPTNSTRWRNIFTTGTTPSDCITDSHTWKDQQAVRDPEGPVARERDPETDLLHGAVFIELPAEVEFLDADTAGVRARQHDCATVHGLHKGNLPDKHLKSLSRPHAWGEGGCWIINKYHDFDLQPVGSVFYQDSGILRQFFLNLFRQALSHVRFPIRIDATTLWTGSQSTAGHTQRSRSTYLAFCFGLCEGRSGCAASGSCFLRSRLGLKKWCM